MAPKNRRRVGLLERGRDPADPFQVHAIGQYHFRVEGATVYWLGPSFNKPGRVLPTEAQRLGAKSPYLVVKIPGGKVWSGIGYPWKYWPTSVYVFRILHERRRSNVEGREIIAERVLNFNIREARRDRAAPD